MSKKEFFLILEGLNLPKFLLLAQMSIREIVFFNDSVVSHLDKKKRVALSLYRGHKYM